MVTQPTDARLARYELLLLQLIQWAEDEGIILTIENVPQQPLAMGNHKMVGSARPARTKEENK
jgi:hypothetical protein